MEDIVIVSAVRTAVGKFGGSLAKVPATDLGALVIKEALARANVGLDQVGEVIMGQVLAAGVGQNPARQAMMKAGVAKETPALTINAVCGSGLKSVMLAAQAVATGDSEIVVAAAAQDAGKFKDEIVPVVIPQRKGDPVVFDTDEYVNRKTNLEALSGLRPAFDKAGTVTAGNASGINDGAAAVVVMKASKAAALGLKPLATIKAYATSGLDPATMGMGPVFATRKVLDRAGWAVGDVDLFELNEAFAAQACAVNKVLDIDASKVNVNGGAIAIGHPIGASGCRVLVTLLHEMQRRDAKKGIASLCIGGGMGVALAVERK